MILRQLCLLGMMSTTSVMASSLVVENHRSVQDTLSISIYNDRPSLATDRRNVTLVQGTNQLLWQGLPASFMPETAIVSAPDHDIQLLEQTASPKLSTKEQLLMRVIGNSIDFYAIDEVSGVISRKDIPLLPGDLGEFEAVVQTVNNDEKRQYPLSQVDGVTALGLEYQLSLLLRSEKAMNTSLSLTYLVSNLSWKADYVATLNDDQEMDLALWLTVTNQSGGRFEDVLLRFVEEKPYQSVGYVGNLNSDYDMGSKSFAKNPYKGKSLEAFTQEISFNLPFTTTLQPAQTKQLALTHVKNLPVEKQYHLQSPTSTYQTAEDEMIYAKVFYYFMNSERHGLGEMLPSGQLNLYQEKQGIKSHVNTIDLPLIDGGNRVELPAGSTPKVSMTRSAQEGTQGGFLSSKSGYVVEFVNQEPSLIKIYYSERFDESLVIDESTFPHERIKGEGVRWIIEVPANSTQILRYIVKNR